MPAGAVSTASSTAANSRGPIRIWPRGGLRAQPRGEVRDRPDRGVVVAALEADPAERRVAGLDSHAQPELGSALAPGLGESREPLLRGEREPDRLELVVGDGDGVVEEDHHAVAREVLERSLVRRDQLAEHGVVSRRTSNSSSGAAVSVKAVKPRRSQKRHEM